MYKLIKRIIIASLCICMLTFLGGCGNDESTQTTKATTEVQKSDSVKQTTEENTKTTTEVQESDSITQTTEENVNVISEQSGENDDGYHDLDGYDDLPAEIGHGLGNFYGVWCFADLDKNRAEAFAEEMRAKGFYAQVIYTPDWENLNPDPYYCVTADYYLSEEEAQAALEKVKMYYPDAYIKFSGDNVLGL